MFDFFANFLNNFLFTMIIPGIMAGIALILCAGFLPLVYKIPAQVLGLVLVVFFVFQSGRYFEVNKAEKAKLENALKVEKIEKAGEKINTETVIRYVDRVKIVEKIKEVKTNVYVTKETDNACVLDLGASRDIARLLNDSARGVVPRTPGDVGSTAK